MEKAAIKFSNMISAKFNYDEMQSAKLQYGMHIIFLTFFKTLAILIISIFLRLFFETLAFLIIYALLKSNSFGKHMKNSTACTVFSFLIFYLAAILIKYVFVPTYIFVPAYLAIAALYFIYAPMQSKKRPIKAKQYKRCKRNIMITLGICFLLAIFIGGQFVINAVFFSAAVGLINVLPIFNFLFEG